jgi:hypothetical protein
LKELNKTLKSIDKSLTSLDKAHGSATLAVPEAECDYAREDILKDRILCDSPTDCIYQKMFEEMRITSDYKKGRIIEGVACVRFGGAE